MNSQTWLRAWPPTIRAGPKLRAGFTEVPVSGMPIRCTTTRAMPMARPAAPWMAALWVAKRTTVTKIEGEDDLGDEGAALAQMDSEEAP